MLETLRRQFNTNTAIIVNAGSLFGTQIVTSGLGFIYWWLAARLFEPEIVGLSSAAISAMMLLGNVGKIGLDTLLVGELPRRPENRGSLITTALLITGFLSLVLGLLFAAAAPLLSGEFSPLAQDIASILLFAVGAALTNIAMVLDQALIGLLKGHVQLQRNFIFAAIKLLILFGVGMLLTGTYKLIIYATWAAGSTISLVYVAVLGLIKTRGKNITYFPLWSLLRELRGSALKHYVLNLTMQIPGYTLPLIVATLISVENTASFYAAWMIASFLFALPYAFTRVLYAVGVAQQSVLVQKIRFTLTLSFVSGILGASVFFAGAYLLMRAFGVTYAQQATTSLRILALSIIPVVIREHFVAISQIHGRMLNAAKFMAAGGIVELSLAVVGAYLGGLTGLSAGWVIAVYLEAAVLAPHVYRSANFAKNEQS